jgi:hypothetical protein
MATVASVFPGSEAQRLPASRSRGARKPADLGPSDRPYVADWDELPKWQQETDADIFERREQEALAALAESWFPSQRAFSSARWMMGSEKKCCYS